MILDLYNIETAQKFRTMHANQTVPRMGDFISEQVTPNGVLGLWQVQFVVWFLIDKSNPINIAIDSTPIAVWVKRIEHHQHLTVVK